MNSNNNSNISPKKSSASNAKNNKKPEVIAYKYSKRGKGQLYEAITLAGISIFLKYQVETGEFKKVEVIDEPSRIIRPPTMEEYPYESYEFSDLREIESYGQRAKKETVDTLYEKAKTIVHKFNDQDSEKLILLAVDIVWSYFQDKFGTTHYIDVVGDNGSGKSTIGDTFEAIAYRAVNMTDPTPANLFRILGIIEPGQCTIVADEAEKIDQSSEILSTLKTGYQVKGKVARVNMNTGKQEFFWTYCIKLIIAERSLSEKKAKGLRDRTIEVKTYYGKPKHDIKETFQPAGDKERETLLNELLDFRKLMLVYRLIHFHDAIADIDIGIYGRQKELLKPSLQLFHKTKSQIEIEGAFQIFLNAKNHSKSNSIEAALHPIIVNLVSHHGKSVYAGQIWDSIRQSIPGVYDDKKPNEYQTHDYDTIYRNTITNIICDKFGADRRHKNDGTVLIFDLEKLVRVGNLYNLETKIQTKISGHVGSESSDGSEGSRENSLLNTQQLRNDKESGSSEGSVSSDGSEDSIGSTALSDKHGCNEENRGTDTAAAEKSKIESIKTDQITSTGTSNSSVLVDCFWPSNQDKQHPLSPVEPSQPSRPSPDDNAIQGAAAMAHVAAKAIHRIHPHSDIFRCDNCKLRGDKWEMEKHVCKGLH